MKYTIKNQVTKNEASHYVIIILGERKREIDRERAREARERARRKRERGKKRERRESGESDVGQHLLAFTFPQRRAAI